MIGKIVGGELALGSDPELEEGKQVLREVKFLSRDEIGQLEHVYPSFLMMRFGVYLKRNTME